MISQRTDRLQRCLAAAVFIAVSVLVVLSAFQKQHWDTDIFWALKSGEWITRNFGVPHTDPFSYTFGGKPWVDFTWGFQVLAHWFFTYLGGWAGLFILQALVTGLVFLVVGRGLRLASGNRLWLYPALLILVFAASHVRLFIRPHLFSYLFISLYILLLNRYERSGKTGHLLSLPVLQVLWVNIHSSAVLGIFIAGSYAAGAVIDELRSGGLRLGDRFSGTVRWLVAAALVLPAVSVLNPYGVKLVLFPFIHQAAENADALRHIAEWTRTPLKGLIFNLWPLPVNLFAFKVLFIGVLASLFLNRKRLRSRDVLLVAGAFYMAASHVRWVPQFAFFAAPVMATNIAGWLDGKGSEPRGVKALFNAATALTLVMMVVVFSSRSTRADFGLGLKPGVYPEGTVEFIRENGLSGNIYNTYVFGGYLVFNDIRPFIDGRTPTVYSPYFFWTSRVAPTEQKYWSTLAGEHGLDMALVRIDRDQCLSLWKDPEWKLVSFDDSSVFYLRDTDRFRDVIEQYGLTEANPCEVNDRLNVSGGAEALEKARGELKRMVSDRGEAVYAMPHRLLGLVDAALGPEYMEEGATELEKAVSIKKDPYTYYDLGLALGKLKRYDSALDAFNEAICLDKGFKEAYLAAGLTSFDAGRYNDAVARLKRYAYLADDKATQLGYLTLGRACFETGDLDCAITYLKRAEFIAGDEHERAEARYRLGNALFEAGDFEAGARYYELALEADPEYSTVLDALAFRLERMGKNETARIIKEILKNTD